MQLRTQHTRLPIPNTYSGEILSIRLAFVNPVYEPYFFFLRAY